MCDVLVNPWILPFLKHVFFHRLHIYFYLTDSYMSYFAQDVRDVVLFPLFEKQNIFKTKIMFHWKLYKFKGASAKVR